MQLLVVCPHLLEFWGAERVSYNLHVLKILFMHFAFALVALFLCECLERSKSYIATVHKFHSGFIGNGYRLFIMEKITSSHRGHV